MSIPGALFTSRSRRRRRTARRLQAGTLAILVSYLLLALQEEWALPIFWITVLAVWLTFFMPTRCGVVTRSGKCCRRTARGWLGACYVHRQAKNNALWATFKLRHPAIALSQRRARPVVPSATRLLAAAACLLPVAERARYTDEYRSELWELAQSGAGRPCQLRYSLRQLRNAPSLGFALRSPHRRSAAP